MMFFERFSYSTDGGSLYEFNKNFVRGEFETADKIGPEYRVIRENSAGFKEWTDNLMARLVIM
jgi:hypothetical protein